MICWGETAFRGLGLDISCQDDAAQTGEMHPLTSSKKARITAVSVGRRVVAVVTENGKGKYCLEDEMSETKNRRKPHILALKGNAIHSLSCGTDYIVMISTKGDVFQVDCKTKPYIPRCLSSLLGERVIQVACGDHHTIALSRDGQTFSWGRNTSGQLGLGEGKPACQSPKPLFCLSETPLAMIAAGGDQSFALSLSGAVLAWGKNSAGQLGVGDKKDRYVPTVVKSLNLKRTVFISCGEEHTAVLTKEGLVMTFGSGEYGQLGHSSNSEELHPRLVAELWGSRVTQIACGRRHTLAYVASLETVYSFGCGEQGQLGRGPAGNQNVPLPVPLSSEFRSGIGTILAGGDRSFWSWETLPCHGKMIMTVDEKLINKWISKPLKTLRQEIIMLFSSASTLNGSFLNQSGDQHYQTTATNSGLDLSLARQAFGKMATNDTLLKKVGSVVRDTLLHSLRDDPSSVEELRVYLILPELLRTLPMDRDLCVSFARAVFRLQPHCLKTLEGLWSKLPKPFFTSLVEVVQSASSWFLQQMWTKGQDLRTSVEETVQLLQKLYEVNHNSSQRIEDRNFYISEMKLFIQSFGRVPLPHAFIYNMSQFMFERLTLYPGIFDLETKCILFSRNCEAIFGQNPFLFSSWWDYLCVNRSSVLADTFQKLRNNPRDYRCPLKVKFENEEGIDDGGLSQEFFSLVARDVHSLQPSVLRLFEDSRLVWFRKEGGCDPDAHYLLGILCGMALYNQRIVDFSFPLALFKKLLGFEPTLEDLSELSPTEARSLQDILNEDEEVVEQLYLDFTAEGREIVPGGREIPVTKCNRQQYVEAYVDFIFNKSVEKQFTDFLRGFSEGCPNKLWKMFLPEELMSRLCGNTDYVWEELKKNAIYEAYEPTDENIQNFWTVFFELSEEKKKKFLSFMTGTDRLPFGGLAQMKITIVNPNLPNPDYFFPDPSTCYCRLDLPNYSSIDVLREKFVHVICLSNEFRRP